MPIIVIGLNHRTAPVTLREKFAFPEALIPAALERLRSSGLASEGVILSTCNRVEIYAHAERTDDALFPDLRQFLQECHNCHDPLNDAIYEYKEPKSIEHLFKVASGLDSMVLGETEVLGQLKQAYDLALSHKFTGKRLNKAFQRAFNVAKHIRTETNIQRGSVSVASVAVELSEKIFTTLHGRHVLVLGAGDTGEKTARALLSRGASHLLVTNRTLETAEALAATLGGKAIPFDRWEGEFDQVDIVISSTSAPHFVLDRARLAPLMSRRKGAPLLLVDIAVPRDIDPEVNYLDNVYLYNIDDLKTIAQDYLKQRQEEVSRCEKIIHEKAQTLIEGAKAHFQQVNGDLSMKPS